MAKTLTEIALDERLAAPAVLEEAARRAERDGEPLVVALVRQAGVGEVALVAALRRQVRVPVTDPATVEIDADALREVPREVCRRRRVLPLAVQTFGGGPRALLLAMADPTDHVAIAEVEHVSGCRVSPTLMPLSAIEELIETGYRGFVTQVMRRQGGEAGGQKPTTTPFHRVADEADTATRLRALEQLLVAKGIVSEADIDEAVRALLRRGGD
ncbi:MAG: hypothetical protein D6689_06765 [Deltaproteobacteria bacterium]|nr:MAG: hypothetical protein D6689_06765 [Deltaproteobacteria bacterium]